MKNNTFIISSNVLLYSLLCLTYIFLNTDSCTQGRIDFYVYSAVKLTLFLIAILGFELHFFMTVCLHITFFNIIKIASIVISIIKTVPYIYNTTFKGINICHGSTDWGGFSNKYGLDKMLAVQKSIERILPIVYTVVPIVLIFLFIFENKNKLRWSAGLFKKFCFKRQY
jgi:hypothetical protein